MPEQDTKQVTPEEQEPPEEIEEEETAAEMTAAPAPGVTPSFRELKVVIIMKGESVMLGVQATDCDPVYTTITGDLTAALQRVPALVDEAKKKWTANPLYPKANLPEPPPTPTPVRQTSGKSGKATTPAAAPKKPPTFF